MIEWLPRVDDGVVELRPLELRDAPALVAGDDATIQRWMGTPPASMQQAVPWIADRLAQWRAGGPCRAFGIRWIEARHALVGELDLHLTGSGVLEMQPGEANLSYRVFPLARGQGIASRAVELACAYLHDEGLATTALIRTEADNEASLGVARRCGFVADGAATARDGTPLLRFTRALT